MNNSSIVSDVFIARRGCPREILLDRAFIAEDTQTFEGERNVKWYFSLTQGPWYGGIWGRLVQSVKVFRKMDKLI